MKNRIGFTIEFLLLLVVLLLSGCVTGPDKTTIYDDPEIITRDGDSYAYQSRSEEALLNKSMNLKYHGFTGVETLWTLSVSDQAQSSVEIDSTVESGDFKMVLIDPDKTIQLILEGTGKQSVSLQLEKGKYMLKIVGRNAAGVLEVRIEADDSVNLIRPEGF